MICKNCGGEFDEKLLLCPYCGAENVSEAVREQMDTLDEIHQKTEQLKRQQTPENHVKKASKYIYLIASAIVVLFLIIAIVAFGISKINASNALNKQKKQLAKLEELYQAGDYEKMDDYLDEIDKSGYSTTFRKYTRVADLYSRMTWQIEAIDYDANMAKQGFIKSEFIVDDLGYVFKTLSLMKEMEEEGFPYGEKEGVTQLKCTLIDKVQEVYLLTDDEITLGINMEAADNPDFTELSEIVAQRMEAAVE